MSIGQWVNAASRRVCTDDSVAKVMADSPWVGDRFAIFEACIFQSSQSPFSGMQELYWYVNPLYSQAMFKSGLKKVTKPLFNFGNDDDEVMEIPQNAKVSRNIGWQTETSSGPNSFGKSKTGFTVTAVFDQKCTVRPEVSCMRARVVP